MSISAARMFKAIEESQSVEKILIDNTDEALYFYSMEGKLIYVNPAFEDITGFSTQELHEKNFIPFVHPDDLVWTMKLWEGLYRGELFEDVEYRIVKMNGETRWSLSTWKIVCDHDGTQIGIQGKQRDITKRKQAEEELQTAKRLAEELARTLTDELQLLLLIKGYPDLGPGSLAEHLFSHHSLTSLEQLLVHDSNEFLKRRWKLTDVQCKQQIALAIHYIRQE